MPAGGTCGSRPCRKATASRLLYRNRGGSPDGLVKIAIEPGSDGKAEIVLRGKGPDLPLPALPLAVPLRIQMQSENGDCFESYFDADGVRANDARRFVAKGSLSPP